MMCVYKNSYAAAGWDFFTLLYINISYKMYTTLLTLALLLQALKLWQFSQQHSTWSKLCKDDEMMAITEQLQKYNGVVMFNQMYPTSEYSPPQNPRPTLLQCLQGNLWAITKKTHLQVVRTEGLEQAKRAAGPTSSGDNAISWEDSHLQHYYSPRTCSPWTWRL